MPFLEVSAQFFTLISRLSSFICKYFKKFLKYLTNINNALHKILNYFQLFLQITLKFLNWLPLNDCEMKLLLFFVFQTSFDLDAQ